MRLGSQRCSQKLRAEERRAGGAARRTHRCAARAAMRRAAAVSEAACSSTKLDAEIDDGAGRGSKTDGAAADLRARASRPRRTSTRLAVGIDLGTTNSLVATVRNGIAGRAARRAGPRAAAVDRALPAATAGRSRLRRAGARRPTIRKNTIVSVKRFMGRGLNDVRVCRDASPIDFVDAPGHGAARNRGRRAEPGRGLRRNPEGLAHARAKQVAGRRRWTAP